MNLQAIGIISLNSTHKSITTKKLSSNIIFINFIWYIYIKVEAKYKKINKSKSNSKLLYNDKLHILIIFLLYLRICFIVFASLSVDLISDNDINLLLVTSIRYFLSMS